MTEPPSFHIGSLARRSTTFGNPLDARLGQSQIVRRLHGHRPIQARGIDLEFLRNEQTAHAVLDEVPVDLRRKEGAWPLEPAKDLQAAFVGERLIDADAGGLAAESLAPRRVGPLMFPIAQSYVERVVLVTDADIRRAQTALWESLRVVAEPGGAAALAGLLDGGYLPAAGERVVIAISGGNTTAVDIDR